MLRAILVRIHEQEHILLLTIHHLVFDGLSMGIFLKELAILYKTKKLPIVLIADIDRKPIYDENLFFIKGQVDDESLNKAKLKQAKTVIILGDDKLEYTSRDAKVILSTLTVESINKNAYTIVEILNESYIPTCKRACADEIILSSNLNCNLIVSAAINHGISEVVSDILNYSAGSQLYKIPVPKDEINRHFMDVFIRMKQNNAKQKNGIKYKQKHIQEQTNDYMA